MRRRIALGLALAGALGLGPTSAVGQGGPPHGWLFGSWTGGLFPIHQNLPAAQCLMTPTVIFTRDVVLRASITDVTYGQRVIDTARTAGNSTEFRFAPAPGAEMGTAGLLATAAPHPAVTFGCDDPNALHVQRRTDNEITFPGCADFPYPLVRCGH